MPLHIYPSFYYDNMGLILYVQRYHTCKDLDIVDVGHLKQILGSIPNARRSQFDTLSIPYGTDIDVSFLGLDVEDIEFANISGSLEMT